MRVYVKSVGTNITMVDIDSGDKFSVAAGAIAKLFGVEFKEGEVWDINASKLDDIAETFRKWQVISRA